MLSLYDQSLEIQGITKQYFMNIFLFLIIEKT